ncbi:MAG TPA: hypothetical protein DEQ65_00065 [Ruminococcaceae bacterium]|nr:hypothetical protein [Oscillospiraceae bacterium]
MVSIKKIESYKDYGKCLCITNGVIEAYVTTDIGPRIIRFGYVGEQNILCSNRAAFGPKDDKQFTDFYGENKRWENLGGHRIWVSPESYPETYYPDLEPVDFDITENGAVFTPKAESENGVAKSLEIKMDADDANMQVIMRVKNISKKDKDFAVWGISVSEKGGTLIIPMNTNDTGLLANRVISVWPYTDLSNDRIYFGSKYATLRQDEKYTKPIKLGFDLNCGTVYYCLNGDIFCKRFDTALPGGSYPDGGCAFETYTNENMIEVESLSELKTVKAGETAVLTESWSLCKKPCDADFKNDKSIDEMLEKL